MKTTTSTIRVTQRKKVRIKTRKTALAKTEAQMATAARQTTINTSSNNKMDIEAAAQQAVKTAPTSQMVVSKQLRNKLAEALVMTGKPQAHLISAHGFLF